VGQGRFFRLLEKKGITEVTKRTLQTLMKENQNSAEEYKDGDSDFF